jgi:hypothetical protein
MVKLGVGRSTIGGELNLDPALSLKGLCAEPKYGVPRSDRKEVKQSKAASEFCDLNRRAIDTQAQVALSLIVRIYHNLVKNAGFVKGQGHNFCSKLYRGID